MNQGNRLVENPNRQLPDLRLTGIERYNWSLAIDNMLDCLEKGQSFHAIDISRLKSLRRLLNPNKDEFSGRVFEEGR